MDDFDILRAKLNLAGLEGDSLQKTTAGDKVHFTFWYNGERLRVTLSGKVFRRAWGHLYVSRDWCRTWQRL